MKSNIVSIITIMATLAIALLRITANPEDIVLHWNLNGDATSTGSKYIILLLPVLSVLVYWILLYYEKNPFKLANRSNIAKTESNAKALRTYIRACTLIAMLLILYVTACSAQYIAFHSTIILIAVILLLALIVHTRRTIRANRAQADD